MGSVFEITQEYWEGDSWTTLGLVVGNQTMTALEQAEVSSISLAVFDMLDLSTNLYTGSTPVVSSCVFDTLQTDYGWNYGEGYNLRVTVTPTSQLSTYQGGHSYRVVISVVEVAGDTHKIVATYTVKPLGSV